jgi:hypothetical protein
LKFWNEPADVGVGNSGSGLEKLSNERRSDSTMHNDGRLSITALIKRRKKSAIGMKKISSQEMATPITRGITKVIGAIIHNTIF